MMLRLLIVAALLAVAHSLLSQRLTAILNPSSGFSYGPSPSSHSSSSSYTSSKLSLRMANFAQQVAALQQAKEVLLGTSVSGLSKAELNEYILKLEKLNPTEDPALSPLLNGIWGVVKTSTFSPVLVGIQAIRAVPGGGRILDVQDLAITIRQDYPRVTAATQFKLAGRGLGVSVVTDIEVESGVRVKESYVSGKLGPLKIPLSTVKTFSRALLISYLDEDLLIARNQYGGSPQVLSRRPSNTPLLPA